MYKTVSLAIVCLLITATVCHAQATAEASTSASAAQLTQEGLDIWLYDKPYHSTSIFERSLALFDQAIEVDSTYALAYASIVHPAFMLGLQFPDQADAYQAKARHASQKAMELDPDLADAVYAQAMIQMMYDGDFEAGGAAIKKAADMAPDNAYIQREYAIYLSRMGMLDEALKVYEKISRLDPDFGAAFAGECNALRLAGKGKEALEKGESINAKSTGHIVCLSSISHEGGHYDNALSLLEEGLAENPDAMNLKGMKAFTLIKSGQYEEGSALFGEIGNTGGVMMGEALGGNDEKKMEVIDALKERIEQGQWGWDSAIAQLYLSMDDTEQALDWFETAYESRAALPNKEALVELLYQLKYHDEFATLREESRMQALFEKALD